MLLRVLSGDSIRDEDNAKSEQHFRRHISPAVVSADANCLRDPQVDSARTPPQDARFLRRLRLSQMQQDSGALRLQRHVQTLRPRSKTQTVICNKTQMGREQPTVAAFTDVPESCGGTETVGRPETGKVVR